MHDEEIWIEYEFSVVTDPISYFEWNRRHVCERQPIHRSPYTQSDVDSAGEIILLDHFILCEQKAKTKDKRQIKFTEVCNITQRLKFYIPAVIDNFHS